MVFSRYVTVLRGAGKTLRCNLFEAKVNLKLFYFLQTTANSRACSIQAKGQPEISQNSNDASVESGIFNEKVSNIKPNILEFTSRAASVCDSKFSVSEEFGNENFTSDDIATENYLDDREGGLPGALDICDQDVSYIAPCHQPSFNFAAYANDSPTIQELAKLGVELYKIETKKNGMKILMRYNFDQMKPYIRFLHDSGVLASDIGAFITKNPYIFTQDMDDLYTRIRYLRAHKFDRDMIARIVSKNPYWLMFQTRKIDERLGFFQREFKLNGKEIRYLTTKQPRLITYSMKHIIENTFAIREEMGFDKHETKVVLLNKPRLLMKSRKKLVNVFDYIHNTMQLSHEILSKQPMILFCRMERLQQRHKYLETLGKNQYDPTKPMYVSPDAIVSGTDADFCRNVAGTTVETYNLYLKSL